MRKYTRCGMCVAFGDRLGGWRPGVALVKKRKMARRWTWCVDSDEARALESVCHGRTTTPPTEPTTLTPKRRLVGEHVRAAKAVWQEQQSFSKWDMEFIFTFQED